MIKRVGVGVGAVVILGLVALQLAGCDAFTPKIKPEEAAQRVADVVSAQTGFHPADVNCPSGVEPKVGAEFDCHYTGPEGKPFTAHVKLTKDQGGHWGYDVTTRPS
jgi:hypothetical protein